MTKQPRIAAIADHTKMFLATIAKFRYQHNIYDVFRDWTELTAAEVHQLPYHAEICAKDEAFERVEADYMMVAKKYERPDFDIFGELLAITRLALGCKHQDFLGQCYMQLEVNNTRAGQYFTPYAVSLLLAQMNLVGVEQVIEHNGGWFTLLEPACGSGGMVIAAAQVLHEKKIDGGWSMYFNAIDIDRLCANMSYIQTGLLGLTGVVWHGNTLGMEMRSHRFTPATRLHPHRVNAMMESTKADWEPPVKQKLALSGPLVQASLLEFA